MDIFSTILKGVVIIAAMILIKGLANPSVKDKIWFAFKAIGVTVLFIVLITAVEFAIVSH